ncbi:hypothetical protein H2O64_22805 [Kordia sp. YSTF-M3]|uniref:Tetratricopeptide repeat protein n=1 Tax=Kordia aestuariivivens TaxID=2759037 RepID=A0ABR7QGA3_9FLAO|nr:hypothetical protein [Kordia aestuariivivens]MBC8757518.1 hypothetical protein [Kordia aestuariivivens]
MDSPNQLSNKSFFKYIITLLGIGIVFYLAIHFGKKYKVSQKTKKVTAFYNQFTDEEYIDFAKQLETSINTHNPTLFDNSVNIASFLNFSNRELTQSYHKRQATKIIGSYIKIGSILVDQIDNDGDFKFTRFYKENGIPHIIFRIYRVDFVNFMDFKVGIQNSKFVLEDSYNFFSGIIMSKIISDIYNKAINQNKQAISNLNSYENINYQLQSFQYQEAYELLLTIPEKNRDAIYHQFLLITTLNLDDEKFKSTIAEAKKLNPNDEKFHSYLNFQKSILEGDLNQLNKTIKILQQHVGEDPIFDLYRGIMYYYNLEYDKAIPFFDRVMTTMPSFYDGYYYKLYTLLLQEKTNDALNLVATMNDNLFLDEEELELNLADFEDFTSSKAYKTIFNDSE